MLFTLLLILFSLLLPIDAITISHCADIGHYAIIAAFIIIIFFAAASYYCITPLLLSLISFSLPFID
jgi:hypothetical protein